MKRREPLLAVIAREQHHPRQDRVHRLRRAQRSIAKLHVVLRHTHGDLLHGHIVAVLIQVPCGHRHICMQLLLRSRARRVVLWGGFYVPMLMACSHFHDPRDIFTNGEWNILS